jgi:multiple sugar transport system permease protein
MTTTAQRPRTAQKTPSRQPVRRRRRTSLVPYVFVGPAAVFFIVMILVPLIYAIHFRGQRISGGGAFGRKQDVFVGFENYLTTFTDPELLASLGRMLVYSAIMVPVLMGSALLLALLLDSPRSALTGATRTAIFMPYAIPGVVGSLMWGFLYLPSTSPLHWIAKQIGVELPNVLGQGLVYGAMANIAVWGGVGFNMIIMYTSLRSIPAEIFDAARIDGCTELQIAWHIKIPFLMPALILTGMFSVIGALQVYSEPITLASMTTTIHSTFFPLMAIYKAAFQNDNLNLAAAMSVVLALGILVLSVIVLRLAQRKTLGEGR